MSRFPSVFIYLFIFTNAESTSIEVFAAEKLHMPLEGVSTKHMNASRVGKVG